MSSRRSKFEIYIDILTQIQSGVNIPTHLMYSVNLSWNLFYQALKLLIAHGLVKEYSGDNGDGRSKKMFKLTEKGDDVLRYFNHTKGLVELRLSSSG